ncbi:MAG: hypothetical protein HRU46_06490, partial [Verrucomicrobiales bacterium]|nr:hypothetical protein [Verrucomicrobiales bacterium]
MMKEVPRIFSAAVAAVFLISPVSAAEVESPYAKDKGGTEAQFVRVALAGEKRTLT